MSDHLLEVKGLEIQFHIEKTTIKATENIEFHVDRGRVLGIVGESGCGKTVIATAIMRLLPKNIGFISGGKVVLDGTDILQLSEKEMRNIRGGRISMIFQDPMTALNPVYTVGNQLIEMLRIHNKKMSKREAFEYSVQMLEKVGITSPRQRMGEYPHQLSGGMQQRVMIAMVLSTNPELLIADEPTTALDVTIQAQILDLIKGLQREYDTAVMLITHDMGIIAQMSDDVAVIYAGEIVEYDDAINLFDHPMHPYTIGLLKSIPKTTDNSDEDLHTIKGTVPSLDNMPPGCRFSNRCEECMDICLKKRPKPVMISTKRVLCWKYIQQNGGESDD